jgi:hypothetical protein
VIRRALIILGAVIAVFAAAFAVVWFVPGVQDAIVKRILVAQILKADHAWTAKDDALHILFCGTGSPIPDPTRAGTCTAIIAGGLFLEDVAPARGPGDTMLASDGLVVTLPAGSKDIKTKTLW